MNLSDLYSYGASMEWTRESHYGGEERTTVDLTGVKLKNVTVVLEDNGAEKRIKDKMKELTEERDKLKSYSADRVIIQAQISVLQEVVSA